MLWLASARAWLVKRTRGLVIGGGVLAIGILAFHLLRERAAFWTIDDSAITYSAAFDLVDHHSLAAYVEGPPIESYSNPLLFFVTAALKLVAPFDPVATHIYLEALVFGVLLLLVWLVLRLLANDAIAVIGALAFGAVELATPSTWLWYGSGLENVWVSAGIVALVWLAVRTASGRPLAPGWGVLAGIITLLRPEAPVYVATFYLSLVAFARRADVPWRAHLRRIAVAAAITAVVFLLFLTWRRCAYHQWLPNTYYAKVPGHGSLKDHFVTEILGGLFGYHRAALFGACGIALMLRDATERIGQILFVMLIAALTMPLVGGSDWMGELRFGTPFIAVAHLAWACLFAVSIARARTPSTIFTALAVAMVGLLLKWDSVRVQPPELNHVTTGLIADTWGARRWEEQERLGVPFPVVLDPDIGGALLVGSMQVVDNADLADYQMAHMSHDSTDFRLVVQYEMAERRPDLVCDNSAWPIDMNRVLAAYHGNYGGVWARKDLVDSAVPADAKLLLTDGVVGVSLSPDTIQTAAPGALVRVEIYVTWSHGLQHGTVLRATAPNDVDEIQLVEGRKPDERGSERRAFLVGMPQKPGSYNVNVELVRPGLPALHGVSIPVEVVDADTAARRAAALAQTGTPVEAARRVAWLREQQVPRLSTVDFHAWHKTLRDGDQLHSKVVGAAVRALRRNAELAELRGVGPGIRAAEMVAIKRVLATCAPGRDAARALCLGHAVDDLRRLGYLGVLDRVGSVASELDTLRQLAARWPAAQRYQALVGIVLAKPSDLDAQNALVEARAALRIASFPPL